MLQPIPGIKIISYLPGRVKLRIEQLVDQPTLAKRASRELSDAVAIKKIDVDTAKGNVLIKYDRKRIREPDSIDQLSHILADLFPDYDWLSLRKLLR